MRKEAVGPWRALQRLLLSGPCFLVFWAAGASAQEAPPCHAHAFYFGSLATEDTLDVGDADEFVISMRHEKPSPGFQLGVTFSDAAGVRTWEFSGALGDSVPLRLVIVNDQGESRLPDVPNRAVGAVRGFTSVERGAAIARFEDFDFLVFDADPRVGGPGFTVGYVTDPSSTINEHLIPPTPDGSGGSCPVDEILKVHLDEFQESRFRRGDADGNGRLNVADAVLIIQVSLAWILDRLNCGKRLDADDNGRVALTDAVVVLGFVFGQGRVPPEPFRACATDPTADGLNCQQSNCP